MKKYYFLILTVLLILGNCAGSTNAEIAQQSQQDSAVFMFYNVENMFDTKNDPKTNDDAYTPNSPKQWNNERYNRKLKNISFAISLANPKRLPEIIGLAEVENRTVLNDLVHTDIMKPYNYKIAHYDSNDGRGIDVALLYQADAFKLLNSRLIPIPQSGNNRHLREILYAKGILYNSDTLHIFINHWKSRLGGDKKTEYLRVQTAQALRNKVDELLNKNPNTKIIICGDMNDEPENKSLSKTLKAKKTQKAAVKTGLYNMMYQKSVHDKGSYNYRGKWIMLDNLIVSNGLINSQKGFTIKHSEGNVVYNKKILYYSYKYKYYAPSKTYGGKRYYGGYSDHLPVYFTLEKQK